MKEEINILDILNVIWNGKNIIVLIVVIAMAITALFNFVVLSPVYETSALVRFGSVNDEDSAGNDERDINSFTETMLSSATLNKILEKLGLPEDEYNINKLRSGVTVTPIRNTRVIQIKVTGTDRKIITHIANALTFELGGKVEISDYSKQIIEASIQLRKVRDSLSVSESLLEEAKMQLVNAPDRFQLKKTVYEDPLVSSMFEKSPDSSELLTLVDEEVNPVHVETSNKVNEYALEVKRLRSEESNLSRNIKENQIKINEIETLVNSEAFGVKDPIRMLNGFHAVFINPALEPTIPIGPRKVFNVFVAAVISTILSIIFVLVRSYWKKENG
jgi:capsular polysaccharide biosynthesis protein